MVTYAQAAAATPLKQQIDDGNNQVTQINALSSGQHTILTINLGLDSGTYTYGLFPLTVSESAQVWNTLFQIFEGRVTTATSQLGSI